MTWERKYWALRMVGFHPRPAIGLLNISRREKSSIVDFIAEVAELIPFGRREPLHQWMTQELFDQHFAGSVAYESSYETRLRWKSAAYQTLGLIRLSVRALMELCGFKDIYAERFVDHLGPRNLETLPSANPHFEFGL